MARPRFTLTDEQLAMLPKLAGYLDREQLADVLGISTRTLRRRIIGDPLFSRLYKQGRAQMIHDVAEALVNAAIGGNVQACIFFLRTQAGWHDLDPRQVDISEISKMSEKQLAAERRRLGLVRD